MRATGAHAAQNLTDFQPLAICGDDDGTDGCLYVRALGTRWMPMFSNRGEAPKRVSTRIQLAVIRGRERKGAGVTHFANPRSLQVPSAEAVAAVPGDY